MPSQGCENWQQKVDLPQFVRTSVRNLRTEILSWKQNQKYRPDGIRIKNLRLRTELQLRPRPSTEIVPKVNLWARNTTSATAEPLPKTALSYTLHLVWVLPSSCHTSYTRGIRLKCSVGKATLSCALAAVQPSENIPKSSTPKPITRFHLNLFHSFSFNLFHMSFQMSFKVFPFLPFLLGPVRARCSSARMAAPIWWAPNVQTGCLGNPSR